MMQVRKRCDVDRLSIPTMNYSYSTIEYFETQGTDAQGDVGRGRAKASIQGLLTLNGLQQASAAR
jgi:hypothetical protein